MEPEITAADLQRLLGVNKVSLADLAKRGVVTRGKKRGAYAIESVSGYCAPICARSRPDAAEKTPRQLGLGSGRRKRTSPKATLRSFPQKEPVRSRGPYRTSVANSYPRSSDDLTRARRVPAISEPQSGTIARRVCRLTCRLRQGLKLRGGR